MSKKSCVLLTCDNLDGFVHDEHFLEQALEDKGWDVEWVPWRQNNVDWSRFDCAIVRTTWDYTENVDLFISQLQKIEDSSCQLFNSLSLMKWNSNKTYLEDLFKQGIDVIPSQCLQLDSLSTLQESFAHFSVSKLVVKPVVGAGAKNTFLIDMNSPDLGQVVDCHKGRKVLIQPYMENVAKIGEYSYHFFNGEFSHAILKTPKPGDFRSQEEFGSHVCLLEPQPQHIEFCKEVLALLSEPHLYARVDFIPDSKARPLLIELELIEPSLYFRYQEKSAIQMVECLSKFVQRGV